MFFLCGEVREGFLSKVEGGIVGEVEGRIFKRNKVKSK